MPVGKRQRRDRKRIRPDYDEKIKPESDISPEDLLRKMLGVEPEPESPAEGKDS